MWRRFASALVLLLTSSCAASMPTGTRIVPFVPGDLSPYGAEGFASIRGQAFGKTRAGDVKYAAGETVTLCPSTPYTEEWFTKDFALGLRMDPLDSRALRFFRTTVADGEGRFEFDDLPPGQYILSCRFGWQWGPSPIDRSEVALGHRCVLQSGEHRDVVLTPISRRYSTANRWTQLTRANASVLHPAEPDIEAIRERVRSLVAAGAIDTFSVHDGDGMIVVGAAFAGLSPEDRGSAIRDVVFLMRGTSGPIVIGEAGSHAILGSWIPGRGYRPSGQSMYFGAPSSGVSAKSP